MAVAAAVAVAVAGGSRTAVSPKSTSLNWKLRAAECMLACMFQREGLGGGAFVVPPERLVTDGGVISHTKNRETMILEKCKKN